MASKSSKQALGAAGKKDVLLFDPENLVIIDDPKHPLYDERAKLDVDERFVLNIMHHGVLEPILVRKNGETGATEVIAGRQRVRACREANKRLKKQGAEPHRVPAVVKRAEGHALMGMMVSENEIRTDDTPINKARKVQRFLELGRTEEEAAIVFGVSAATIKNMTRLLDAPKAVQKAVETGAITTTDGYKLARLEPEEQKEKLEELKTSSETPRAPKQKRTRAEAKKARAIVDGEGGLRGKKEIKAMLERLESEERIKEMHRAGAIATLQWVLGGNELEGLMG